MLGGINFEDLAFQVGEASINYGMFIQAVINFFLIALIVFFILRAIMALEKEFRADEKQVEDEESEPPQDIQLLTEIRDLLKENSTAAGSD